jgi:hypothetical protein
VDCTGDRRGACRDLVEKSEEKRPLGRPKCRWKNNIKINIQGKEWGMNWIELAQYRDMFRVYVNTLMNFRFP